MYQIICKSCSNLQHFCLVFAFFLLTLVGPIVNGAEYQLLVENTALQRYSTNVPGQLPDSPLPVRRSRLVELTPDITSGSHIVMGDTIILNLFPDTHYVAHIVDVSTNINQTITMSGFVESYPFSDLFICRTGNRALVSIYIPDTDQRFIIRKELNSGIHRLLEVDTSQLPLLEDGPSLLPDVKNYVNEVNPEQDVPIGGPLDPANIDVMIVYTPAAYEDAEFYFSGIDNGIASLIHEANTVLTRSQTHAALTLVHSAMVDYVENRWRLNPYPPGSKPTGSVEMALYDLQRPDDSYMDEIHDWRDKYGADLVAFIVSSRLLNFSDEAGMAFLLRSELGDPMAAFSVVVAKAISWVPYIFTHEIGHNMGCGHHKDDPTSDGLFNYSHGWKWSRFCSVMSYLNIYQSRVGVFSNPDILYAGSPTGDPNKADNARTIRETKHAIAAYRPHVDVNAPIHIPVRIYVDTKAPPGGNGESWATAYHSLRNALIAAQNGDEIWVAAGIYKPTEDTNRKKSFLLNTAVSVYGGFVGTETERDQRDWIANQTILSGDIGVPAERGDNSFKVVVVADNAIIDGFTIVGGYADGGIPISRNGGGIYHKSGDITVANCTFNDNYASQSGGGLFVWDSSATVTITNCDFNNNYTDECGGGIYIWNSDATAVIVNCDFNNNYSGSGGGIYICWYKNATATIMDCDFNNNYAEIGGGIYTNRSKATIVNCAFNSNYTNESGGGISIWDSNATVVNCSFNNNQSDDGGAIASSENFLTVVNSSFKGNSASRLGGGVADFLSKNLVFANCTFVDNRSGELGGGIYTEDSNSTVAACTFCANEAPSGSAFADNTAFALWPIGEASDLNMSNCIIWNGDSPISIEDETTLSIAYSNISGGWEGIGNINADPVFVRSPGPGLDGIWGTPDDDYGDLRLKQSSPCIDSGSNAHIPADIVDLDDDGDITEPLPFDLIGEPRILDGNGDGQIVVDMGAYEYFQPINDPNREN